MGNANFIKALIIGLPLLFGGVTVYNAAQPDTSDQSSTEQIVESVEQDMAGVTIGADGTTATYEGMTGKTALEILREGTEVGTEESSFGEFVRSIDGRIADEETEYWAFLVDGEYASEGAGTYETTDGEQIEWVLEQLN